MHDDRPPVRMSVTGPTPGAVSRPPSAHRGLLPPTSRRPGRPEGRRSAPPSVAASAPPRAGESPPPAGPATPPRPRPPAAAMALGSATAPPRPRPPGHPSPAGCPQGGEPRSAGPSPYLSRSGRVGPQPPAHQGVLCSCSHTAWLAFSQSRVSWSMPRARSCTFTRSSSARAAASFRRSSRPLRRTSRMLHPIICSPKGASLPDLVDDQKALLAIDLLPSPQALEGRLFRTVPMLTGIPPRLSAESPMAFDLIPEPIATSTRARRIHLKTDPIRRLALAHHPLLISSRGTITHPRFRSTRCHFSWHATAPRLDRCRCSHVSWPDSS